MKPENPQNIPAGIEHTPKPTVIGAENIPRLPSLDTSLERGQEHAEQVAEAGALASDTAVAATATATVTAAPATAQPLDPHSIAAAMNAPLVAADDDLIEKEWVDKAKEIIEQTKDDPHARTARVNELQRAYLQKRYGKVVGTGEQ